MLGCHVCGKNSLRGKVRLRTSKKFYIDDNHGANVQIVKARVRCEHIPLRLVRRMQGERDEDARRETQKFVERGKRVEDQVLVSRRDLQ